MTDAATWIKHGLRKNLVVEKPSIDILMNKFLTVYFLVYHITHMLNRCLFFLLLLHLVVVFIHLV